MATKQDPAPFLARLGAGAVRDSIIEIWRKLNQVQASVPLGALTFDTAVGATVGLDAAISLANATPTIVPWTTIRFPATKPPPPLTNIPAQPTRLTFPRDTPRNSIWAIQGAVQFDTSAVGRRVATILFTDAGGTFAMTATTLTGVAGVNTQFQVGMMIGDPTPGGYIELQVEQVSGGALNLQPDATFLSAVRLF